MAQAVTFRAFGAELRKNFCSKAVRRSLTAMCGGKAALHGSKTRSQELPHFTAQFARGPLRIVIRSQQAVWKAQV